MLTWIKSLAIYLILASLVINFAPSEKYKKYISFFSGLIVILIIATPVSYILRMDSVNLEEITERFNYYMEQNSGLQQNDEFYDYYEMSLGEAIKQELFSRGSNVSRIEVVTDKDNTIIAIRVYKESAVTDEEANLIKNVINEVYNVEINSIYIVKQVEYED